jgi:hypothetical protein
VDHRPALAIVLDDSVKETTTTITPKKDLEKDYKDISSTMNKTQVKE